MRSAAVLLALLVSACGGVTPQIRPYPMPESANVSPFVRAYEAGKAHLVADRVGLAIVMFERALAIDPRSVAALNGIGTAYDELHRPEIAKHYYSRAIALEPKSADTLNNMAISAALAGNRQAAARLFAGAAALDPTNEVIRENILIDQQSLYSPARVPVTHETMFQGDEDRPQIERTGFDEFTLTLMGIGRSGAFPGTWDDLAVQCVPYARAVSGIGLHGNAVNWWEAASGIFARGNVPEPGSIMNFRGIDRMPLGHVAVVTKVVSSREVRIDHAHWLSPAIDRNGVSHDIKVIDVSANNDWSMVRVQYRHQSTFGNIYPIYGFIYNRPERPDNSVMIANKLVRRAMMTKEEAAVAGASSKVHVDMGLQ